MGYRLVVGLLLVLLVFLQYRLWIGEGSLEEVAALKADIKAQSVQIEELRSRNEDLRVEVKNLQDGLEAIEARARRDYGMIKDGEVYYQIVEPDPFRPERKR